MESRGSQAEEQEQEELVEFVVELLDAVAMFCLICSQGPVNCIAEGCELHPYRFGNEEEVLLTTAEREQLEERQAQLEREDMQA